MNFYFPKWGKLLSGVSFYWTCSNGYWGDFSSRLIKSWRTQLASVTELLWWNLIIWQVDFTVWTFAMLQGLTPVIDDFLGKSSKLAASLRSTVLALSSFLERSAFSNLAKITLKLSLLCYDNHGHLPYSVSNSSLNHKENRCPRKYLKIETTLKYWK